MNEALTAPHPHQPSTTAPLTRRWVRGIGITAAVGLAYFLLAELGLGLYGQTTWVPVFWPAFGISAGTLIALGPSARLQVAVGVIAAIVLAHLIAGDPRWLGATFALADGVEPLVTAGLVQHFFGPQFSLGRLRHLLGLLAAAILASVVSFAVVAVSFRWFQASAEPILTMLQHWFITDMVGFVSLAPFLIGLFAAARQPPGWRELLEGGMALVALALMTAVIIFLPQRFWDTSLPVAWLFPMLFWLAARCRPVFAAAGVCIVSITVVWTTVFGIGHFGNAGLPIAERNLQAQATILVVALGALVLAALFAERRDNEGRLARSKEMLEHERDNRLVSAQAITAAIAHELKQPLTAVVANGSAALEFLRDTPANHAELQAALMDIVNDATRASEAMDGIRALFRGVDQRREPASVNQIVNEVLRSLHEALEDHQVTVHTVLAYEMPLVQASKHQLQELISNLVRNAIEAMDATRERERRLWVRTELRAHGEIAVAVQDSGPGIDPSELEGIFEAFFTTKQEGMGLGLAICRMIAEHHGGRLTAASDGKLGALFELVLPVAGAQAAWSLSENSHGHLLQH
jgi:signal transduction histidine kinase